MSGTRLTLVSIAALAAAGLVRRRGSRFQTRDQADDWCRDSADYWLVQEGWDLSRLNDSDDPGGRHWSTRQGAEAIEREGFGLPLTSPWWGPEEHELAYLYCLLDGDQAARYEARFGSGAWRNREGYDALLVALRTQWPQGRVLWFSPEPDYDGGTAWRPEVCYVLDLEAVGDWLSAHATEAYVFPDNAVDAPGYGLFWNGPAIPRSLARRCS